MASPSSQTWEVSDLDLPPASMTTQQILESIPWRRFSLTAKVRSSPSQKWGWLSQTKEFAIACPDIRWNTKDQKIDKVQGVVSVANDLETLLAAAKRFRTSDSYKSLNFYLPVLSKRPGPPYSAAAVMFKLWDWFFAGVVVESSNVRPNMLLHGHVIAFNFSGVPQMHSLIAKEHPIPEDQMPAFAFDLPPGRWAANPIYIPVKPTPGDYAIELRSTSTAAKVGKAAAVTALTLGMFTYYPGHKGFRVPFRVLSAQDAKTLDDFEAAAAYGVQKIFLDNAADHAVVTGERTVQKPDLLTEFRRFMWFNPDRTFGLMDQYKAQDEAVRQMLDRFATQVYGGSLRIGTASYPSQPTA